tara:strand:- start:2472 stop:3377 length:906 start_codon:yes stop_codon:yes gene_type:complete
MKRRKRKMSKRRKFYGAKPESVRAENTREGGNFYLDLPDGLEKWSPKDGDNYIRILPSCDPDFDIWFHVWFHYNPQSKKYFLCPKNMSPKNSKQSCPVCEEFTELQNNGESDNVCRQFKPQARTLFFIIDREDEKKGVQVYPASRWQVAVDIFDQMEDKRKQTTIDIADSGNGYDIIISKEGKGMHTKYKAKIDRDSSGIGFDDWEEELVSFADVIAEEKPYDEIKVDFFGGGNTEEEPEEPKEEEPEEDDVQDHDPPLRRSSSSRRRSNRDDKKEEPKEEESGKKESVRDRLKRKVRSKR